MGSYIIVSGIDYGFEGLKTSVQTIVFPDLPYPYTLGQMIGILMFTSLIGILYLSVFTAAISLLTKSKFKSAIISIVFIIINILSLSFFNIKSNIINLILNTLPTGAAGIYDAIFQDKIIFNIFGKGIWYPVYIIVSGIILITILTFLISKKYNKQ